MFFMLTVPELTACFRSTKHRTLHSINVSSPNSACTLIPRALTLTCNRVGASLQARTAFFTMAVGALTKSCAKVCTTLTVCYSVLYVPT